MTLIKVAAVVFLGVGILLTATTALIGWWGYSYWTRFSAASGLDTATVQSILDEGWSKDVTTADGYYHLLVLGVDQLSARDESALLTDTILVTSIDVQTGQIRMVSLPRDIWSEDYQTKINALYSYGFDRDPDQPTAFPASVISELVGVEFQSVLVLTLDDVAEVVDLVGGVKIEVPVGFVDDSYPVESASSSAQYRTVEFTEGFETMNGERVLEYIRSRKSQDDQGSDIARSTRQQQVITALIEKLQTREVLLNPELLGRLYQKYDQSFAQALPPTDLVALGRQIWPQRKKLEVRSVQIPFESDPPLLVNPPVSSEYQNLWVYLISDLEQFREYLVQSLQPRTAPEIPQPAETDE